MEYQYADADSEGERAGGDKLWERTCAGQPLGQIKFTMPSRYGVTERKVRQQLWSASVEFGAGKAGSVAFTCMIASEVGSPAGSSRKS